MHARDVTDEDGGRVMTLRRRRWRGREKGGRGDYPAATAVGETRRMMRRRSQGRRGMGLE
jgi:hypothetical protein